MPSKVTSLGELDYIRLSESKQGRSGCLVKNRCKVSNSQSQEVQMSHVQPQSTKSEATANDSSLRGVVAFSNPPK